MRSNPDHVLEGIADSIDEMLRLETLTNEELVTEYLKLTDDQDDKLHTNEMCTRLWPGWENSEVLRERG